ncbi:MAG TPA: pseudouridine synthase [Terracidiphilus sp.]|nr:pseudouridine synthase [Terracidiphilus sp.]
MSDEQQSEANEAELNDIPETQIEDPIGDVTDGEAATSTGGETEAEFEDAADAETEAQAEAGDEEDKTEPEFKLKARPPAKLERLQKILAQAGVASRRKAEEMIEQGRVQLNGKVVTELGTKADAGRDHIRVDGKLLQGAERLRYFVLNKPRGFVTTVKDPEGRATVMQFFEKMRERLYPVGRLDYMSEGLLLVTNDGELANKLTRASAGVEKTYLVKVAGQPTEDELDVLRAGVAIEKGKPGSGKVRTSPARIRQVRQGDNPWYEVVLIEGRNRELRKMFEEIGHFVEKIRRVGYGPLILDQEPGKLRELDAQELDLLRKAADGNLKTPKAKEIRRRNIVDSLPPEKPAFKPRGERPAAGPKDYRPKKSFGTDAPVRGRTGPAKFGTGRPAGGPAERPARPPARFGAGAAGEVRPAAGRSYGDRPVGRSFGAGPGGRRPFSERPAAGGGFPGKPAWKKPEAGERPPYKRSPAPRPEAARRPAPEPMEDLGPKRPSRLHIEPVQEFERTERARTERHSSGRPPSGRAGFGRTGAGRSSGGRSSSARPFRGEGGLARPFTTSSGKPRAGGARPSSKPGKEGGRSYGAGAGRSGPRTGADARPGFGGKRPFESKGTGRGSGGPAKRAFRRDEGGGAAAGRPARPYTPRGEGAEGFRPERKTGSGWKPKPNFGGKSKTGDRSRPKAGGFSKSGYKGKPGGSGGKRGGPRPGGKKRG